MMHVIMVFMNFLHWYVILLKFIFMHKLGLIMCFLDDQSFSKVKLIGIKYFP